jgi:pilus assembly protein Flp/PilA
MRQENQTEVEGDTCDDKLLSVLPPQEDNRGNTQMERTAMKFELLQLCAKLHYLMTSEEGQDLIEYALLVAMVCLAATAAMQGFATDVNSLFANLGNTLSSATT